MHLQELTAAEEWSRQEVDMYIDFQEMIAVFTALTTIEGQIIGQILILTMENAAVYVNKLEDSNNPCA